MEPPRDTMPIYREERMPAPPPGGGYHDSYGTADVEADQPFLLTEQSHVRLSPEDKGYRRIVLSTLRSLFRTPQPLTYPAGPSS